MAQCPFRTDAGRCQAPGDSVGPLCSYSGEDFERECRQYPLMAARRSPQEAIRPPEPPIMPPPPEPSAPEAAAEEETGFRLTVEDAFSIQGRGTVVTGQVERGVLRVGDELTLTKPDGRMLATVCNGIEVFRRTLEVAQVGDNVGLFLRGIEKGQAERGDIVTAAGSAAAAPSGAEEPSPLTRVLAAQGLPPAPPEVEREIGFLVGSRQQIEAIKQLREQYPSLGLKEAKDIIDELAGSAAPSAGKCFIAAAACGSVDAPAVLSLRQFRDRVLRPHPTGAAFIRWYERLSPPLAELVSRWGVLRAVARYALVRPAARLARRWLERG